MAADKIQFQQPVSLDFNAEKLTHWGRLPIYAVPVRIGEFLNV